MVRGFLYQASNTGFSQREHMSSKGFLYRLSIRFHYIWYIYAHRAESHCRVVRLFPLFIIEYLLMNTNRRTGVVAVIRYNLHALSSLRTYHIHSRSVNSSPNSLQYYERQYNSRSPNSILVRYTTTLATSQSSQSSHVSFVSILEY
jgi:hypothetical protein